MIFYRPGYARVPKVTNVSGNAKDWDEVKREAMKALPNSGRKEARSYYYFKRNLEQFTEEVYNRKFSTYYFNEIKESFIKDFVLYTQERGTKNGNKAGLVPKLKLLYGVFFYSNKLLNMPDTDVKVLECAKEYIKRKKGTPQTISYDLICRIEKMDKSKFSKLERFYIDVFL
ncbi:MAG: hypothetical protein LBP72_01200, partial [Dysgonamonadaceae bacterium]|nr:hypothetical protein [Dysgonamonadaceae bacterium]